MESPASSRGRNRSAGRKRNSLPAHPSSSQSLGESAEQLPSNTPADEMRSSSFTFETPSPSQPRDTRKRARQVDGTDPLQEDAESKGGRSLRKRARVDYTFDQQDYDETYGPKSTPTSSRSSKKRKSDVALHDEDLEKEVEARVKRRASEQPQSAPRRRGPAKRATIGALPAYVPDAQIDDVEVQDTIEVGGHHSSHSDESPKRPTGSTSSSADPSSPKQKAASPNQSAASPNQSAASPKQSAASPKQSAVSPKQNAVDDTAVIQEVSGEVALPDAAQAVDLPERKAPDSKAIAPELEGPEVDYPTIEASQEEEADPLEHLTPFIEGATTLYPINYADETEADPEPETAQEEAVEEPVDVAETTEPAELTEAGEATEAGEVTEAVEVAEEETPSATPRPTETRANSPAPESDVVDTAAPKQYEFKQTRDASEFTALFTDIKSLSHAELYRRLEIANDALLAWQEEYKKLKRITDDEDNSIRYNTENAAFQHRQKMALSRDPNANPVQKDFVLRGTLAPKPDPLVAYARQQDRIMANAYLFEYDDRESRVGQQDPIAQRSGAGKGRLRDRPKQTAKAAEADDANVIVGKRTRKPPVPFDGGETASRGATPAPAPARGRRRRGAQAAEENGDAQPTPQDGTPTAQNAQAQPTEQQTPKKKGKGGRPRKHPLPAPIPEETQAPAAAAEPEPQLPPQPEAAAPAKRTRKRKTKAQDAEEEKPATNGTVQETTPQKQASRRQNSRVNEIPSGSFYTASVPSTGAPEESRPQTASSTATVDTVTSNYQLREKRRTNFAALNNSTVDEQPGQAAEEKTARPKRVRRAPKKIQSEDFAPFHESMPTLAPAPVQPPTMAAPAVQLPNNPAPPAAKPPTRIKIKNYHPPSNATSATSSQAPSHTPSSTATSTPPLSANGNGGSNSGANTKDYNDMTKSEKMSHSMKARWASGSMNPAVVKRRATLALKKQQADANAKPSASEQVPDVPPMKQ